MEVILLARSTKLQPTPRFDTVADGEEADFYESTVATIASEDSPYLFSYAG